jgi:hypothetical protein
VQYRTQHKSLTVDLVQLIPTLRRPAQIYLICANKTLLLVGVNCIHIVGTFISLSFCALTEKRPGERIHNLVLTCNHHFAPAAPKTLCMRLARAEIALRLLCFLVNYPAELITRTRYT